MKNHIPNKFLKTSEVKCRLCGKLVRTVEWRKHLRLFHKVGDYPRFKDFFLHPSSDLEKARKQWYDPDKKPKAEKDFKCGDKFNQYLPKVKIVYNAVCSNRKKY